MSNEATRIEPVIRARRRWFRYSLRTLFLLVTVLCVLCAVLVWKMVPAIRQKNAINAIHGNGTIVASQYDFEVPYFDGNMRANLGQGQPGLRRSLVSIASTM
jgi:hypothetical protein